jgi:hypothetical protein
MSRIRSVLLWCNYQPFVIDHYTSASEWVCVCMCTGRVYVSVCDIIRRLCLTRCRNIEWSILSAGLCPTQVWPTASVTDGIIVAWTEAKVLLNILWTIVAPVAVVPHVRAEKRLHPLCLNLLATPRPTTPAGETSRIRQRSRRFANQLLSMRFRRSHSRMKQEIGRSRWSLGLITWICYFFLYSISYCAIYAGKIWNNSSQRSRQPKQFKTWKRKKPNKTSITWWFLLRKQNVVRLGSRAQSR